MEKRYIIKTALIAVALILAGCQSKAIQPTTTPTPTEIPATATLIPSPIIEPTATTPPTFIKDGGSVLFWNGTEYALTVLPEGFVPDHFAQNGDEWQVVTADGSAFSWNGNEWVVSMTALEAAMPTESLAEGSPMWKKMELFGLTSASSMTKEFAIKEIEGNVVTIGKNFYLEQVISGPFEIGSESESVSGTAVVLVAIGRNEDGSLSRVRLNGAIQIRDGKIGLGIPTQFGSEYDRAFPRDDRGLVTPPSSLKDIEMYYKKFVGKRIFVQVPIWLISNGTNQFNPDIFAASIFPNYDRSRVIVDPGEGNFQPSNAMYWFAQKVCALESCYQRKVTQTASYYSQPKTLGELDTPFGLLLSQFSPE